MTTKIDTRQSILDAAVKRILHYGYAKTTMSEIACDCSMSAGNIYRFFASKLDIAEAMARKFNAEHLQSFAEIARGSESASERLRGLFAYSLESTFQMLDEDAKILEVAEVLARERPEYANEKLAQVRLYITQIINDGIESGEFAAIGDPEFVAEMIQSAMMKFTFPQLFSHLNLEKLQREMNGVMDLVLAGLKSGVE